ncbi:NAD(P)/FAD-dependent oxidoreductase [Streptomyces sp. NPDC056544]|uniref:NAD(P)/FAD-dependent oxidoreductase n=1 Tax=unclassified Streptomyces TaxID=2593676 RepID=UPI00369D90B0
MRSARERLAIVISDEIGGVSLLQQIHMTHANTMLALLSGEPGTGHDYITELDMSPESLEEALEELFFTWKPPNPRVTISGQAGEREGRSLRRFLYLNGVPYLWKDGTQSRELTAHVDGTPITHPTPSQLYVALGIIPPPNHQLDYPYDLVVVGGGPAGLSAALSASLVGFSTLVIEAQRPGGTATTSINLIQNYLGFPGGLAGTRLAKLALEQLATLDIDWRSSYSARALKGVDGGRYEIQIGENPDDAVTAGMVLLACGQNPKRLIFGEARRTEELFLDRGIYYSAVPSDRLVEVGKDVVIVGGGDSAGQTALMFAKGGSRSIAIVARGGLTMAKPLKEEVRSLSPKLIKLFTGEVTEFSGAEHLAVVDVKAKVLGWEFELTIPATSAYIHAGGEPNTKWLTDSGIDLDDDGYINTDVHLNHAKGERRALPFETNLPGVFAAGDVRVNSLRRVGQAVGQGTAAVASMERYVKEHPQVLADPRSTARLLIDILGLTQGLQRWVKRRPSM